MQGGADEGVIESGTLDLTGATIQEATGQGRDA